MKLHLSLQAVFWYFLNAMLSQGILGLKIILKMISSGLIQQLSGRIRLGSNTKTKILDFLAVTTKLHISG